MSTVEKAMDRMRVRPAESDRYDSSRDELADENLDAGQRTQIKLDRAMLRRAGLLPPLYHQGLFTREYQRIKRPIIASLEAGGASRPDGNRFMVTSANPREGKSFCSFNLALSLAGELDYSVLLVDGDIPRPMITRTLSLTQHPGLMDVLTDSKRTLASAIVDTDVPGLSVMPCGTRARDPVERLSSRRMMQVMRALSADPSRVVLIDSPPILATVESQAISHSVSRILLVVKADATEQRAVTSALSLIDTQEIDVSLILNASRRGVGSDYAGYYGDYHSDYNRGDEHAQA